jgi:hypothetical protein
MLRANRGKLNADSSSASASSAESYAKASEMVALQNVQLLQRVEALEKQQTADQADRDKLKVQLRECQSTIDDLRDWAERLCHQVSSLGGTPVKIRGTGGAI